MRGYGKILDCRTVRTDNHLRYGNFHAKILNEPRNRSETRSRKSGGSGQSPSFFCGHADIA